MEQVGRTIPGSNAERSRVYNRGLVLGHVRDSVASGRAAIARACGLSTQAVSNIIAELEAEGMLREAGRLASARGLPAVQYEIEPSGGYAIGIEVRPGLLHAALIDLSGAALWTKRQLLPRSDPGHVATAIARVQHAVRRETAIDFSRLRGAGVVIPGPFGDTGLADPATQLPDWSGISPSDWFAEKLDLPVLVENDANAVAIAERHAGAAQGLSDYLCIYFGIGLGLGIVSGGGIVRGAFGNAGELGHLQIGGKRLEDVASRLALSHKLAAANIASATVEDLEAALQHPATLSWLADAGEILSDAILILENLFDPDITILGGAMPAALIDALLTHIPLSSASLAARPDRRVPRLRRGSAGRLTATLGAGAMAIDRIFTARLS